MNTLDPRDKPCVEHLFVCECCWEILNRHEGADPCKIEGEIFCDTCASDLTQLRLDGYLKPINLRTKQVVEDHNRKLEADLADMIYPIHSVRHI